VISVYFNISEAETNRTILDTARARLFDPAEDTERGAFRANLVHDAPFYFVCLAHVDGHEAMAMGSLPGQGPVTEPYGRYFGGRKSDLWGYRFFKRSTDDDRYCPHFHWLAWPVEPTQEIYDRATLRRDNVRTPDPGFTSP
jgi:hypothetical protein